jgi:phosphoadenosine phosphosulfate reductase
MSDILQEKVDLSVGRLRHFEPSEGYWLAFSGGKDSCVLRRLADLSGVRYDAHYSVTTIDPPELVRFIRSVHPDVRWERPERPFLRVLPKKGFPLRQSRWCCDLYKERGGAGRLVLTGIRAAESTGRARRKMTETCTRGSTVRAGYAQEKRLLHPILDWTDDDVWSFIEREHLPVCSLYAEGFKRIGCVLCPMAAKRRRIQEAERWPRMTAAYIKAFEALYADRMERNPKAVERWTSGRHMFAWWLQVEDGEIDFSRFG